MFLSIVLRSARPHIDLSYLSSLFLVTGVCTFSYHTICTSRTYHSLTLCYTTLGYAVLVLKVALIPGVVYSLVRSVSQVIITHKYSTPIPYN